MDKMQNKANAQPALAAAGSWGCSWGLAELGNYITKGVIFFDDFEHINILTILCIFLCCQFQTNFIFRLSVSNNIDVLREQLLNSIGGRKLDQPTKVYGKLFFFTALWIIYFPTNSFCLIVQRKLLKNNPS